MKTMSKEEEIILVEEMIKEIEQKLLEEGNPDRLYLSAELDLLNEEYLELVCPRVVIRKVILIEKPERRRL